ncbi:hypothetical protein JOB18_022956 [Solea senegalensis]|uniref:Uncharacterized protein n=1 Tax=Solea senegalensis TaxID=28829 RepID=A0AAV6QIJ0_SOLSE|nr:hypothetical protein JOB18_003189 [Solea senegalensis]KAG7489894.1 hypothetical protein JOB18_022956 [Solea senegalensis]
MNKNMGEAAPTVQGQRYTDSHGECDVDRDSHASLDSDVWWSEQRRGEDVKSRREFPPEEGNVLTLKLPHDGERAVSTGQKRRNKQRRDDDGRK